ncbi:MAG: leucine-rich repeat domain-containing protein [Wolbachia sp.]
MSFSQSLKGDTLVLPCAVNIGKLVSFLRSNTNITKLSLPCREMSSKEIKKIAKLTNLTSLSLQNCNINDECIKELVGFSKLTSLSLAGNNISSEDVKELAKLPNLTFLDLSYTNITDEDIKELQNKLPNCRIEFKAIIKPNTDMKYYVGISAAIGLLLGLSTAYLAGAAALTPVGAAIAVFFAAAVVGALVGYGVGKSCQRVSEERQEDPDLSTWDAVKSVISDAWTTECSQYSRV